MIFYILFFIFLGTSASADPVSAVIISGFGIQSAFGVAAVKLGVGLAVSRLASAITRGKPQKARDAGVRSTATTAGGLNSQTFVLGRYMTAGNLVAPPMSHGKDQNSEAPDTPNSVMTHIIDFSDMRTTGVVEIHLNDTVLKWPDHFDTGITKGLGYRCTAGIYTNRFYFDPQIGATEVNPRLQAIYGARAERPWQNDMIGRGISWAAMHYIYDREVWTSEPRAKFVIDGIKLYDPRKDSSVGGNGAHRWGQVNTYEFTENPKVMIYNLMRKIDVGYGVTFGVGVDADDLPLDSWAAAMTKCDDLGYTAGFEVVIAEDEPFDVIDVLLNACDGEVADIGGVWYASVSLPTLPVAFITDDDILVNKSTELDPFPSLKSTHNGIHTSFISPSSKWQEIEAPPRYDLDGEAADGQRLIGELSLKAVTNIEQAQRLARAWLLDARRMRRHTITLGPEGLLINPLDHIQWTSARNGYIGKRFDVGQSTLDPDTLSVTFNLRERNPDDYDWNSSYVIPTSTPSATMQVPVAQTLPLFALQPYVIEDSASNARRPALLMTWFGDLPDVRAIRYEVRVKANQKVIAVGSMHDVSAGRMVVSSGILPNIEYEARARMVVDRPTSWTAWVSAVASNVKLTGADILAGSITAAELAASINAEIDAAAAAADAAAQEASNAINDAATVAGELNALIGDFLGDLPSLAAEDTLLSAEIDGVRDDLVAAQSSLGTSVDSLTGRMSAAETGITDEQTARTNADTSITNSLNIAVSRIGDAEAAIGSESSTRADADTAIAGTVDALTVRVGDNEGAITAEVIARADADSVITGTVNSLTTRVGDAETAITDEQTARSDADSALSTTVETVSASLNAVRYSRSIKFDRDVSSLQAFRTYSAASVAISESTSAALKDKTVLTMTADSAGRAGYGHYLWVEGVEVKAPVTLRARGMMKYTGASVPQVRVRVHAWPDYNQGTPVVTNGAYAPSFGGNANTWVPFEVTVTIQTGIAEEINIEALSISNGGTFALADLVFDEVTEKVATEALISQESIARVDADNAISGTVTKIDAKFGSAIADGSLLENGNFSTGDFDGWTSVTPGLNVIARDPNNSTPPVQVSPSPYMVHAPLDGVQYAAMAAQDKIARAGEKFVVTFDSAANGSGTSFDWNVRVYFSDQAGNFLGGLNQVINVSGNTWTKYKTNEVTAPSDTAKIRYVHFIRMSGGSGASYLTNVRLERLREFEAQNAASIVAEQVARANADSALTSSVNTLTGNVGTQTARIDDIRALKVSALAGTSLATFLTQLQVNSAGTSGLVSAQGSAISTLEGQVDAMYTIDVQSGSSGARLDLIAPSGSPSVAQLDADFIYLKGRVAADSLLVGLGGNMLANSDFVHSRNLANFGTGGLYAGLLSNAQVRYAGTSYTGETYNTGQIASFTNAVDGYAELRFPYSDVNTAQSNRAIPITPNGWYSWSAQLATIRCECALFVYWYDSASNYIGSGSGSFGQSSGDSLNPDRWTRHEAKVQAPANAAYAFTAARMHAGTGTGDKYVFVHKPMFAETHAFATEPPAYSRGVPTIIDDAGIYTDAITTRHVKAGTVTAASAILADASVVNAKIANLAVNTAKIANLAVDTLQVAGNAITDVTVAQTKTTVEMFVTTGWNIMRTAAIQRYNGAPNVISLSFTFAGSETNTNQVRKRGNVRIMRGSTVVDKWHWVQKGTPSSAGASTYYYPEETFHFMTIETDQTAGLATYQAQMDPWDESMYVDKQTLIVDQAKK